MLFKNRKEAGKLLASALKKYKGKDVIVYCLPRGGVVTGLEIARYLNAPLDLIITRKIGHPNDFEYALAAVAKNGHIVATRNELTSVDGKWLKEEIEKQRLEAVRRGKKYLHGRSAISAKGKIAILVDDGVATGLTLRVGIIELKHRNPSKLIVAVPIIPKSVAQVIESETDELIALEIPSDDKFLGSVGAYYEDFSQVEDQYVVGILNRHKDWLDRKSLAI